MRSGLRISASALAPQDTLEYSWKTSINRLRFSSKQESWNRLAARVATPLANPQPGSLEEFIVEHYWGYARGRDGITREYRVAHPPWRIAAADNVTWECDIPSTYNAPLADYLAVPPTSAIIADGSPIQVFRGCTL